MIAEIEFRDFVLQHERALRAYIARELANRADLDDIEQRVWERLWKATTSGQGAQDLELRPGLMYAMASSELANHRRGLMRRERLTQRTAAMADRDEHVGPAGDDGPDSGIQRAIERLSADDRQILDLRFNGGASSREIAVALGASDTAIRRRLSRALARFRALCDEEQVTG